MLFRSVVEWSNKKLKLKEIDGNFVSTLPVYGFNTGANYKFTSHTLTPSKYAQVDVYAPENPLVKMDDTEYTMDSSNTSTTLDKTNTPDSNVTEY